MLGDDWAISDLGTVGYHRGVYGAMDGLGTEFMLGDFALDGTIGNMPQAVNNPVLPNEDTIVVKTLAREIKKRPVAVQRQEPTAVVEKRVAAPIPRPGISRARRTKIAKAAAVGLAAVGLYYLLTKKE